MRRWHLPCSGSTFGALLVQRKHFWCTSGLVEAFSVHFRFGKALPVWRKHFRFGGSTSGLAEALPVWRKHFWCTFGAMAALLALQLDLLPLLVVLQHFHPLPVRRRDFLALLDKVAAPSVHFRSVDMTCRQLLEERRNLPSTSERVGTSRALTGPSVHFQRFLALSSISGMSTKPSCIFCQFGSTFFPLPVWWWPLPSTSSVAAIPSDNIWFGSGTFRRLPVRRHSLLSTFGLSTGPFCASTGPSVYFLCILRTFRQLSWTFCVSVKPSLSCPSGRRIFHQPPSAFNASTEPSINFRQVFVSLWELLKKCRMTAGSSVNFSQLSVQSLDLLSAFRAPAGPSVNIPFVSGTYHKLPSTFCASEGPSVNFPCINGTFRQTSAGPQNLPSTSINFPCICGTFRELTWTFGASVKPSLNFPHCRRTFYPLPPTFRASAGPSVNFPYSRGPSINFRQLSVHLLDYPITYRTSTGQFIDFPTLFTSITVAWSTDMTRPLMDHCHDPLPSRQIQHTPVTWTYLHHSRWPGVDFRIVTWL